MPRRACPPGTGPAPPRWRASGLRAGRPPPRGRGIGSRRCGTRWSCRAKPFGEGTDAVTGRTVGVEVLTHEVVRRLPVEDGPGPGEPAPHPVVVVGPRELTQDQREEVQPLGDVLRRRAFPRPVAANRRHRRADELPDELLSERVEHRCPLTVGSWRGLDLFLQPFEKRLVTPHLAVRG